MRDIIKFRVWDVYEKVMAPVAKIHYADDGFARTIMVEAAPKDQYFKGKVHTENCILLQWTGLQDSENTDIYEGDILELTAFSESVLCEVQFRGAAILPLTWYDSKLCKVIGNRYQNPELLEKVTGNTRPI
jgi:uncharacterized phage protein (TIGR01671 family)